MSIKNKVQLIGNVGQDPIVKVLENGSKVVNFTMATNETYKKANGQKETDTQWHNIVAWNKTADIVDKYVKKGQELAVVGKLTHRSYEDKEGVKRYLCEIIANEVLLMGGNVDKQTNTSEEE